MDQGRPRARTTSGSKPRSVRCIFPLATRTRNSPRVLRSRMALGPSWILLARHLHPDLALGVKVHVQDACRFVMFHVNPDHALFKACLNDTLLYQHLTGQQKHNTPSSFQDVIWSASRMIGLASPGTFRARRISPSWTLELTTGWPGGWQSGLKHRARRTGARRHRTILCGDDGW